MKKLLILVIAFFASTAPLIEATKNKRLPCDFPVIFARDICVERYQITGTRSLDLKTGVLFTKNRNGSSHRAKKFVNETTASVCAIQAVVDSRNNSAAENKKTHTRKKPAKKDTIKQNWDDPSDDEHEDENKSN